MKTIIRIVARSLNRWSVATSLAATLFLTAGGCSMLLIHQMPTDSIPQSPAGETMLVTTDSGSFQVEMSESMTLYLIDDDKLVGCSQEGSVELVFENVRNVTMLSDQDDLSGHRSPFRIARTIVYTATLGLLMFVLTVIAG